MQVGVINISDLLPMQRLDGKSLLRASSTGSSVSSLNPSYDCPHFGTIHLHARAHANVCARESKRQLDGAMPLEGIQKYLLGLRWAGIWIKTFRQKIIEKRIWKCGVACVSLHHREGTWCFAFHWIWGLYSEWFSIFRMSQRIQSSFAQHHSLQWLHQHRV